MEMFWQLLIPWNHAKEPLVCQVTDLRAYVISRLFIVAYMTLIPSTLDHPPPPHCLLCCARVMGFDKTNIMAWQHLRSVGAQIKVHK